MNTWDCIRWISTRQVQFFPVVYKFCYVNHKSYNLICMLRFIKFSYVAYYLFVVCCYCVFYLF